MLQVWLDNDHWIHVSGVMGHDADPDAPGVLQNDATVKLTVENQDGTPKSQFWPITLPSDGSDGSYSAQLPYEEADVSGTYKARLVITLIGGTRYEALEPLKMSQRAI